MEFVKLYCSAFKILTAVVGCGILTFLIVSICILTVDKIKKFSRR
jgi:hypothetical protein